MPRHEIRPRGRFRRSQRERSRLNGLRNARSRGDRVEQSKSAFGRKRERALEVRADAWSVPRPKEYTTHECEGPTEGRNLYYVQLKTGSTLSQTRKGIGVRRGISLRPAEDASGGADTITLEVEGSERIGVI